MNTQITAQDAAAMSQDDFDQLDSATIDSLLRGPAASNDGGSTPPPAEHHEANQAPAANDPATGNDPAKPKAEDGDDPEVVTIDEDGRARNAKGKFVPHKALHAEREEHKKTRASLQQAEIEKAKYSERLNMLLQALEPEKPAPTSVPAEPEIKPINVEEDLIGAIKQMQELALKGGGKPSREVQELQHGLNEIRAHNQVAAISNRYAADVKAAREDATNSPGFEDAVRHVVMQQDAMLQAQGWTDPAQRRAQIQQAERQFVMKAYQDGANPAARLYAMAKATGWQHKAANGNGAANGANGANGAHGATSAEQRIDNIAKMQRASPTLSNSGGTSGDGLPSAAQIASMNEEDFDAFVNKVGGLKAFERRYMGR